MSRRVKPAKPYPEFPLYAHASGQWAKVIRRKTIYFGPWAEPEKALAKYMAQRDALHAGRHPKQRGNATVGDACNHFLLAKQRLTTVGELSQRTWDDYRMVCARVIEVLGRDRDAGDLQPDDFARLRAAFAATHGPVVLSGDITRVRVMLNHALANGLIEKPPQYGTAFEKPSRAVLRRNKAARPARYFTAAELRTLIAKAGYPMKAMLLLAINCGFGNADLATLPLDACNLEAGWVSHPRPKTGIERRCPLWPETIERIRRWLLVRPVCKLPQLFVTAKGNPWNLRTSHSEIAKQFTKLARRCDLHRSGRGVYSIRHTFATVAEESLDHPAVSYLMGHAPRSEDMAAVYRRRIDNTRLQQVVGTVHRWLLDKPRHALHGAPDAGPLG
ncbi:MAG: tyrosine-type recombinase/integrase [Planctomycetota bacterium]|jgi:integrase